MKLDMVSLKQLLPIAVRDRFRPAWESGVRDWRESRWSKKPLEWHDTRERVRREADVERLFDLAGSEFGITQVPGEIIALIELLRDLGPRTIVEIGTHKGGNSFLFCHSLPSAKVLVGVDLCVQNAEKLIYFARPGQRYHALHGDSQKVQMRHRVRQRLGSAAVDFLFIDGDHRYAGVKSDFELYAPLVRSGGLIALHDIVPDHHTRFGRETGCDTGEVHHFWAELKKTQDCSEIVADPDQDGFGIGVIHVR